MSNVPFCGSLSNIFEQPNCSNRTNVDPIKEKFDLHLVKDNSAVLRYTEVEKQTKMDFSDDSKRENSDSPCFTSADISDHLEIECKSLKEGSVKIENLAENWQPCSSIDLKLVDADVIKGFECQHCPYRTKKKRHLDEHIINKHTSLDAIKWFECELCPFKAKIKNNLTKHFYYNHTPTDQLKWYNCEICDFRTKYRKELTLHQIRIHEWQNSELKPKKKYVTKPLLLQCDQCLYQAKRKHHLKEHMIHKHTAVNDIKWLECAQCSFKAKVKTHLQKHMIYNHTAPERMVLHKCPYCPFESKYKKSTKTHISNLHDRLKNEPEAKIIQCSECSYRGKTESHLKTHVTCKHTPFNEIRWIKCEKCNFRTKTRQNLKLHILRRHTENVKWLQCKLCLYKTRFERILNQHVLQFHQ